MNLDTYIDAFEKRAETSQPKHELVAGETYKGFLANNIKARKTDYKALELQLSIAVTGTPDEAFRGGYLNYAIDISDLDAPVRNRDGETYSNFDGSVFTIGQSAVNKLMSLGIEGATVKAIIEEATELKDVVAKMTDAWKGIKLSSIGDLNAKGVVFTTKAAGKSLTLNKVLDTFVNVVERKE